MDTTFDTTFDFNEFDNNVNNDDFWAEFDNVDSKSFNDLPVINATPADKAITDLLQFCQMMGYDFCPLDGKNMEYIHQDKKGGIYPLEENVYAITTKLQTTSRRREYRGLINRFFFPNKLRTKCEHVQVKNKNGKKVTVPNIDVDYQNIEKFRSFYFDFDLANINTSTDELSDLKANLLRKMADLPLPFSATVETRNGFHCYYFVSDIKNEAEWTETENVLLAYMREIDESVDFNCKNKARILRVPYSYHFKNKEGNRENLFQTKIISMTKQYKMIDIKNMLKRADVRQAKEKHIKTIKAFGLADTFFVQNEHNVLGIDSSYLHSIYNNNGKKMSVNDFVEFLTSEVDMRDILHNYGHFPLNRHINAIFRDEKKPSAIIQRRNDKYTYIDFGDNSGCGADNISIIRLICHTDFRGALKIMAEVTNTDVDISNSYYDASKYIEEKKKNFRNKARNNKLSDSCKKVFYFLLDEAKRINHDYHVPCNEICVTASISYIIENTKLTDKTVKNSIKKLQEHNFIKKADCEYAQLTKEKMAKMNKYKKDINIFNIV